MLVARLQDWARLEDWEQLQQIEELMRCEEHKNHTKPIFGQQNSWSLIHSISDWSATKREIDGWLTWSNWRDFRPGYSHRMILVRWEAERCFPGSNLVAESHGKDGVEDGHDRFQSWCDVMIWNPCDGLQVGRFGKHHFCFYISGSLITFSYLCSFRSNLGWLASHCRLKTQVLELQTFMSFRNWHLLVCWEFALGQHVQLDPDIVFEHLWTTFDWSSCFLLLLTVHIRTKSFRVLSHICNERKNIFLHWHQSGTQTYCWWTTSIQNPASSDMIR